MEDFRKSSKKLEKIGQGFCGTVWSEDGGALVVKRADGGPGRSLPNESYIHTHVLSALTEYSAEQTHLKDEQSQDDENKYEEKRCEKPPSDQSQYPPPRCFFGADFCPMA